MRLKRMTSHIILYISDQKQATEFYQQVLGVEPKLDVSGMTKFNLPGGAVLGLMPEGESQQLLGEAIPDPSSASGVPRPELYLVVPNPDEFLERAHVAGASLLSEMQPRDWGHTAAYCTDLDGHVLAFACDPNAIPVKKLSFLQRLHNTFGPIAAGLVLDFFDLVTFGPVGWTIGPFIGFFVGWYLGGFYDLRRSRRFGLAIFSAGYLAVPMTAFIPLGTIVAALARMSVLRSKPHSPC